MFFRIVQYNTPFILHAAQWNKHMDENFLRHQFDIIDLRNLKHRVPLLIILPYQEFVELNLVMNAHAEKMSKS